MKAVDHKDPGIAVAASAKWKQGNLEHVEKLIAGQAQREEHKNWDWTYTTMYRGTVVPGRSMAAAASVQSSEERIDIARLKQPDPILYWDDAVLYEDEVSDNGQATLSVKIRVMPTCLLLLQRFFLRVDGVLLRLLETRLFLDFRLPYFVREWVHKEDECSKIMDVLGEDYPIKCRDANALGDLLTQRRLVLEKVFYRAH